MAGIVYGLIISAGFYGLVVGVALAGGRNALLICLVLLLGLLHGCLTALGRSAVSSKTAPVDLEPSSPHVLGDQQR